MSQPFQDARFWDVIDANYTDAEQDAMSRVCGRMPSWRDLWPPDREMVD